MVNNQMVVPSELTFRGPSHREPASPGETRDVAYAHSLGGAGQATGHEKVLDAVASPTARDVSVTVAPTSLANEIDGL
jgi:hypothetical protein